MKNNNFLTVVDCWRRNLRRGLKPIPKISVSEWADKYRVISEGNAEPGKWRTSRAEYQREIMNAFTQTGIHRVVVMTSSQIGKSDIMNNVIGRFAHVDPAPIMMVQPTVDLAQDFSKSRISPMIRDTKILKNLFFGGKSAAKTRDADQTILSKFFPGGRLVLTGANSPSSLASRPVRILLCDEVDRFPVSAGSEGDPVGLAEKRMTTFWNYILGLFSTPTTEGASRIEVEYKAGTQEEWRHQCPNCGEFHAMDYRQMITDYDEIKDEIGHKTIIVKSVKWQCPDCGMEFSEIEMKNTPQKYIANNPDALKNGIRSFWLNAFSSPWLTWENIMREWYEAKGDPAREKVVMNTRFGKSYREVGEYSDEKVFLNRREDYGGELHKNVLILTAAVDVQDNRLEYEICGWSYGQECYGINKGIIYGLPNLQSTWDNLDAVLDREYHFPNGKGLKVARTFIDSGGHFTSYVYDYCLKNHFKGRFAIKGQGGLGLKLIHQTTRAKNFPVLLTMLGVNEGKQQVMTRLGIETQGEQYFHFPLEDNRLGFPRGYDEIYFRGLISERKVCRKKGGAIYFEWEPLTSHIRNEPLDLRVYNLACLETLRVDWAKQAAEIHGEKTISKKISPLPVKKNISASKNLELW